MISLELTEFDYDTQNQHLHMDAQTTGDTKPRTTK